MSKKTKVILAVVLLLVVAAAAVLLYLHFSPKPVEGAKTVTVEVVHSDESKKEFVLHTDAENLHDALDEEKLIEHIVGEKLSKSHLTKNQCSDEVLFSAKNVNTKNGNIEDVSFELHKGEILGIYGLRDQGQALLLDSLFGVYKYCGMDLTMDRSPVKIHSAYDAVANGISMLPERGVRTNFRDKTITENMIIQAATFQNKTFFISPEREKKEAYEQVDLYGVRGFSSLDENLNMLSGGNIQKVLIARIMMNHPKVMMFVEPTLGIDIGAKNEVKRLLLKAAADGCGIIIVTAEIDDIIEICNRAMIIRNGHIVDILESNEENRLEIIRESVGAVDQESLV